MVQSINNENRMLIKKEIIAIKTLMQKCKLIYSDNNKINIKKQKFANYFFSPLLFKRGTVGIIKSKTSNNREVI